MKCQVRLRFFSDVLFSTGKYFFLSGLAVLLVGCVCAGKTEAKKVPRLSDGMAIANPASVYCIDHGGTLSIRKRGDGGEYGICEFAEGRQCEEWAMMRGACPIGGIAVSGDASPAARYCVITGGTFRMTDQNNTEAEQGVCMTINRNQCDAGDYYHGKCPVCH